MNNNVYFALLVAHISSSAIAMAYDDEIMSPVQVLKKTTLTENVTLSNSSEIYLSVAKLRDRPGLIRSSASDVLTKAVALAWKSDPRADTQPFEILIHRSASILDAIRKVAARRGEKAISMRNYVLVDSKSEAPLLSSYEEPAVGGRGDLTRLIDTVIATPITLIEPGGEPMEGFINTKLRQSGSMFRDGKQGVPVVFRMDEDAKSKMRMINAVGMWTYRDLFNAICGLTGLRWRIEGEAIWLRRSAK